MPTEDVASIALEETASGAWIVRERDAAGNVETSYYRDELAARFHLLDMFADRA